MPGRKEEIEHAIAEGVQLFISTLQSRSMAMRRATLPLSNWTVELGEPDASGRRRPVLIPDSTYDFSIDIADRYR